MSGRPVLIMAGGTGGHVFPALAVARVLRQQDVPVLWLGTRSGLEAQIVPAAGLPIAWLSVSGLRGKGWAAWMMAPLRLGRAVVQAFAVLRRERPRVVLGLGGFVAGPGGLVAALLRLPLVIHEQNAVAGLTNRLLAPLSTRVLEGFPRTFAERRRPICTGNPVRSEIAQVPPPERRLPGREGPLRLLVLGGSLGAAALNAVVPAALAAMAPGDRPQVRHQAGSRNLEAAKAQYRAAKVEGRVLAFIDDMAEAYAWADLVICRAGALTVAELAAAGAGSILVPYPHAVDDHQTANARFLGAAGAAILVPQSDLSAARLAATLGALGADRARLVSMARAARALARPAAAEEVAGHCLDVALSEAAA
jgi:UDP-N-acetylglucosamine--N-acetylmuramyl-(pentapeptide) pyrophosphoryl-undecaprenol N-acetylglucosamine transferase